MTAKDVKEITYMPLVTFFSVLEPPGENRKGGCNNPPVRRGLINFCSCPKNFTNKLKNFPPDWNLMMDGAKFNSHDSGSHFKKSTFKNGHWKKNSYIFSNWVEVASKIEHAVAT